MSEFEQEPTQNFENHLGYFGASQELLNQLDENEQKKLKEALRELQEMLESDAPGEILVTTEKLDAPKEQLASQDKIRQILLTILGVKDYEIRAKELTPAPEEDFYTEIIQTNWPGVRIIINELAEKNARTINLEKEKYTEQEDKLMGLKAHPVEMHRKFLEAMALRDFAEISGRRVEIPPFEPLWKEKKEVVQQAKYILLDLDGCLIPAGAKQLSLPILKETAKLTQESEQPETAAKAGAAAQAEIVFSTGRATDASREVISQIEKADGRIPWAICENGCVLLHRYKEGGKMKEEVIIHPQITQAMKDELSRIKQIVHEEFVVKGRGRIEPGKAICVSIDPPAGMTTAELEPEVIKILEQKGISPAILGKITHSTSAVDITPPGINKKSGLELFCQKTGSKPQEQIGIGDSKGDLPVLEEMGATAVPHNAAKDIGIEATYTSPYDDQLGVLDILRQIEAIKKEKLTT